MVSERVNQNTNNIDELKRKVENNSIKIEELSLKEIELLKLEFKKEILNTDNKIDEINKLIKNIKVKIDNWNKD